MKSEVLSDEQFLNQLHERICPFLDSATYIAACYCVLDDSIRSLRYGILGHTPPLFHYKTKSNQCYALRESDNLWIQPGLPCSIQNLAYVQLDVGDVIVLCTDGIGAFDADVEGTTEDIKRIIVKNRKGGPNQIASALLNYDSTSEDDKTVIVVKVK